MKWKCFDCLEDSKFDKKYENGKGLILDSYTRITLVCSKCTSQHLFNAKYEQNNLNNTKAFLIYYETTQKFKTKTSFMYDGKGDMHSINGFISNIYLVMGFDNFKVIKDIENKISNKSDKALFKYGTEIIKLARNKITQHNKDKESLSKLDESEIFSAVQGVANMLVNLTEKYNLGIFDSKDDKRIKKRELVLVK